MLSRPLYEGDYHLKAAWKPHTQADHLHQLAGSERIRCRASLMPAPPTQGRWVDRHRSVVCATALSGSDHGSTPAVRCVHLRPRPWAVKLPLHLPLQWLHNPALPFGKRPAESSIEVVVALHDAPFRHHPSPDLVEIGDEACPCDAGERAAATPARLPTSKGRFSLMRCQSGRPPRPLRPGSCQRRRRDPGPVGEST